MVSYMHGDQAGKLEQHEQTDHDGLGAFLEPLASLFGVAQLCGH